MHHTVDGIALTDDVLRRATRRHQRRTATIRTGSTLGLAGLAVVVAAGLAVGGRATPPPDAGRAATEQVQPAALRLANAAAASDNISYRLRLTTGTQTGNGGATYEGAFDPKTATGYLRMPQDDSVMTELLVNGTRYIGGEPPLGPLPADKGPGEKYGRYGRYPGTYDRLSLYCSDGSDAVLCAAAPDPSALFKALQNANATITQNPDGTLHFQYTTQIMGGSSTISGDVTLNADGRIAKVMLTSAWQTKAKGRLDTGIVTATLELFDYGLKVTVQPPADVVPAN
jgi:hypothetical protein